jgi:phosphonate transport system substrate-binding protein
MARVRGTFLIALAAALLAGCGPERGETVAGRLRIAFVPQADMEERYDGAYRALGDYLRPRLGVRLEVVALENANAALEGLRANKLDVCNFSPWPFLLAERKAGVEALLLTRGPDGSPARYRTLLVARPASGVRVPEDLVRRSREIVFSFEEPVSTSGHLVPRAYLHSLGINPERDFRQILFGPDGVVNLLAVKSGRVDVAALSSSSYERALAKGRLRAEEVVVVWTSPPVLSTITAIRREVPAELKRKFRDLMVAMPQDAPDLWAEFARQFSNRVVAYVPAEEAALAPYREAVRTVPGLEIPL